MKTRMILWCGVVATALAGAPAAIAASTTPKSASPASHSRGRDDARQLHDAKLVINKMKTDRSVSDLLKQSKGVFLIPNYGRAALVGGGSGDEGLLLAHYHGDWSDPVFYIVGAIHSGRPTEVKGERIAMIAMTDKAINRFKEKNSFSLNADSGLKVVEYSKGGQTSAAGADVVLWSDTNAVAAGASVNASNISADESANRAYYGVRYASPEAILSGVSESRPAAAALRHDLPA